MDTIIRSVEAGLGVAVISEKVASSLEGRINISVIRDFNDERSFYMIYLKNLSHSPAAEVFAEYVKQSL